ncbi:MAG: PLP-dependent aminotransferase family protein [Pseudomonadota bacterium]
MKLYEAFATEIADSIRGGVLRAGDRLPSVRQASTSRQVSPSTVFQAYYLLEAQGLIRARERSGYYVSGAGSERLPEPEQSSPQQAESLELGISARISDVLDASMSRDVVPFGSAFPGPDLFPIARLGRAMASSVQKLDPWSMVDDLTPGSARLRRQIALRYLVDGLHVHADDIVVTNGALEALNLCLAAVTRPGDAVLVESPTFYAALQSLERLGLRAVEVPTHPRDGVSLEAMALAIERHRPTACWLMTNFQNPLGSLVPDARKQALVELLGGHGIPLIEDDVYGELYFGDRRPVPAKAFDTRGLVLHCASFSKCLAPGYRIGWAAPGRFVREVARLKLATTLATCVPAQVAVATYLEEGGYDRHLRKLRLQLALQQARFVDAVGRYFPAGTRATRPTGGYFLWVELPPGTDALALHRQALSLGISVAPGPIFSASRAFENCLRLNYGHTWNDAADTALRTLGRLVSATAPKIA